MGPRVAKRNAWHSMKARAGNRSGRYPTYKDVTIDPRWSTFEGFIDHPPRGAFKPGMVLSRDGDKGNYSPENCRWTTKAQNARENKERYMLKLPDGRFALDVARENGISVTAFGTRCCRGWPLVRAATEPMQDYPR